MPKRKKEDAPPPEPCVSVYGARGSSVDELEAIISKELEQGSSLFLKGDSTVSTANAGAHDVWIPRFLAALEKSPNWSVAARAAGVDKSTPSKRAESDPEFAKAAAAAEQGALDLIEAATFKSAVYGDLEPIYHMGVRVGEVVKYSHPARELLLKAGRPEKYRERLSVDSTTRNQTPTLTAEDRQKLVLELLPSLGDYARFLKAKPVIDV